jgi:signal transduction histidine kinase
MPVTASNAYIKSIFLGLCTLLLCLCQVSCNDANTDTGKDENDIQQLINQASLRSMTGNFGAPINFIDSALEGKKLSFDEKVKVLSYKCEVFDNQLHDHATATTLADSLLRLIEKSGVHRYPTEYARANYGKGDILFNEKKYDEAYTYYYKARSIGKANLDSCTLSEYSFRLALILYRQSRFQEAADVFQRSYQQSKTCEQDFFRYYRIQQILDNVGLSFYKSGKLDSALIFYQKALDFINTTGSKYKDHENSNDVAKAVVYGNMADIYTLKNDNSLAKDLLKKSININVKKGNDNKDAQYSQVKLAEIYSAEGATDSLMMVLNQLKQGLDTVPNTRAEMDWNRMMWKQKDGKDVSAAYAHLVKFNLLRDSLEHEASQIKSTDLSQQIKTLESQYQIQALQKNNEIKNIYLWLSVILSVIAVIIVFFIFRNLIRSKKNVELLQSLNNQVNEQKVQLQQALDSVEEKGKQQERILRAVAHDLRAPVATISMLCDLVDQEENPESRKEMVNFIRTSCNNSLQLIAEILEAADQSGREEQEKESVSINQLVKSSVDLLQLKAKEKQQNIVCNLLKQELFVMLNADKIKRVINNLVNNAIKFSPKEAEINLNLNSDDENIILSVKDNGIGIPEEIQDKVFDMFTEAKRKGTAGELPYGLGLSICKQIVEAHNGTIWFNSKPGEGTTFYVRLPI